MWQVAYVPEGLKAVVFTADGYIRQALNSLQATSSGFQLVNQDNVFKVHMICHFSLQCNSYGMIMRSIYWGKVSVMASDETSSWRYLKCQKLFLCFWNWSMFGHTCLHDLALIWSGLRSATSPTGSTNHQALYSRQHWRCLHRLETALRPRTDIITTLFRVVKNYEMVEFLKLEFIRVSFIVVSPTERVTVRLASAFLYFFVFSFLLFTCPPFRLDPIIFGSNPDLNHPFLYVLTSCYISLKCVQEVGFAHNYAHSRWSWVITAVIRSLGQTL